MRGRIEWRMDPLVMRCSRELRSGARSRRSARCRGRRPLVAALAPDLDALIQSTTDPLLFLEFHRQFTHALPFVPLGALLCTAASWRFVARACRFGVRMFSQCWATRATSCSTRARLTARSSLPFSGTRFAWNFIAVIDPLFTLPVSRSRPRRYSRAAPASRKPQSLGLSRTSRWRASARACDRRRRSAGSEPRPRAQDLVVTPALFSLLLWKSIYEHGDTFYVDAVRAGSQ